MIGDGPDRTVAEWMAREKNLSSDVIFLGKQNQVQDLLHCGDVLLLPSDIESFGLAALEGMASGVPAICSCGSAECRKSFATAWKASWWNRATFKPWPRERWRF